MQLLKWLSVTDRFYKISLDKQLAPYGINNSQYMFLIKICRSPGILQDSLMDMFYVHPSNIVRTVAALEMCIRDRFLAFIPEELIRMFAPTEVFCCVKTIRP